jgi:hypothetical protein
MADKKKIDYSDQAELKLFRKLGTDAFGLRFDKITFSGAEANLVGIKTKYTSFSKRLDSRTYFVHDARYGTGKNEGIFRGSDKDYFKFCRDILKQLKIPSSEIAGQVLLKEQTQQASIDRKTGKVAKEPVQDGKYFARLMRQVDGLPVWSSVMVLGLAAKQRIGYLQLHWPEISEVVILEAHRLAHMVKRGWKPPEQPGASVESVEAGIVHSPALGFFLDTHAAIRVIYEGERGVHRQKPVYFYDRHGRPVPIPRQIEHPKVEPQERKPDQRHS